MPKVSGIIITIKNANTMFRFFCLQRNVNNAEKFYLVSNIFHLTQWASGIMAWGWA